MAPAPAHIQRLRPSLQERISQEKAPKKAS